MKYNFVLIPSEAIVSDALITLAKEASINKGLTPIYLLKNSATTSIPHVSVVQFEITNSPDLFSELQPSISPETLWLIALETWTSVLADFPALDITLDVSKPINYKHDTAGTFAGISWAEILIDKIQNPLVQQFHDELRKNLEPLGITCMNGSGPRYNPHFTLFNIPTTLLEAQGDPLKEIPESYKPLLKNVSLIPALGVANDQWELVQKVQELELSSPTAMHKISS